MIYYGAKQIGKANEIAEKSCGRFLGNFEDKFTTHAELRAKHD